MNNTLYDVYYKFGTVAEIWNNLIKKYIIENTRVKKYIIGKFLDFKIMEEKFVTSQLDDFQLMVNDLAT